MTEHDFIMWLHGYLEICNPTEIGPKETQIIKDHLNLFFDKVTPLRMPDDYMFSLDPCGGTIVPTDVDDILNQPICIHRTPPTPPLFDFNKKLCNTDGYGDIRIAPETLPDFKDWENFMSINNPVSC